jgi:hypothetical protein
MRIKTADLLKLGVVLLAVGAAFVGWQEASSASARAVAVLLTLTTGVALVTLGVYRMAAQQIPFSRVYPIFLVAVGVILELLSSGSPLNWGHAVSGIVTITGLVLYLRNALKSRRAGG